MMQSAAENPQGVHTNTVHLLSQLFHACSNKIKSLDFQKFQASDAISSRKFTGNPYQPYQLSQFFNACMHASGRQTIGLAKEIIHSKQLLQAFNFLGTLDIIMVMGISFLQPCWGSLASGHKKGEYQ